MRRLFLWVTLFCLSWSLRAAVGGADNPQTADATEARQPHTPTLIFYLTGAGDLNDSTAIHDAVGKLKSATTVEVNTNHSYARIRFDSHIVSYHQVAQAIVDAGTGLGKKYDPWLVFSVTNYDVSTNALDVDRIFAGKRLNTRVTIKPLDKSRGLFKFTSVSSSRIHIKPLRRVLTEGISTIPSVIRLRAAWVCHPITHQPMILHYSTSENDYHRKAEFQSPLSVQTCNYRSVEI